MRVHCRRASGVRCAVRWQRDADQPRDRPNCAGLGDERAEQAFQLQLSLIIDGLASSPQRRGGSPMPRPRCAAGSVIRGATPTDALDLGTLACSDGTN